MTDAKTLKTQRDHARSLAERLIGLLNEFPTAIEDFEIEHSPAPGDGWNPLGDDDDDE